MKRPDPRRAEGPSAAPSGARHGLSALGLPSPGPVDTHDLPDAPRPEPGRALAVAISYDPDSEDAPKVVASGKGAVAERILALAFENGVKVRQDADLVEILSVIDVGEEIPVEAFIAVAEILAYVYRANGMPNPFAPATAQGA